MKYYRIVVILLAFSLLQACVEKRDLTQNTVIAHISANPDGLHAFNNNSAIRSYVFNYTQQTLITLDLDSQVTVPMLIKSLPTVSEDGLEYTYELIDEAKWDDGSPLTVDDVIFSTKLMLCPLTNNTQIRGIYSSVIDSIRKHPEDANKFIVRTKILHVNNAEIYGGIYIQQKSFWDPEGLLNNLTFQQIHSENFDAPENIVDWFNAFNNADNSYQPEKLVGLGPYKVTEFVVGSHITIERKKNWYGENSKAVFNQNYPEKIIFKIIKDPAASYLAVKNQQIDVSTGIGTSKLMKLQNIDYFNESYHSDFVEAYGYNYMGLNTKPDGVEFKPFFTDKKVRRAIAHLVPVEEIIDVILRGKGVRQVTNISSSSKYINTDLAPIDFNVEKAKKMLDEAGWIDTDGNNIRDKVVNGEKLQFSFKLSYLGGAASKEVVLMIKEAMYQAGIDVVPFPMDFSLLYKNAGDHKFDAMMGGWSTGSSYSDPVQLWHTESWANKGSNFCGFGDAESDSLIHLANTSLDYDKHLDAVKKLQAKIYDEQPYVFLYSGMRKCVIHKRFGNANFYKERPGVILNNLILGQNDLVLKPE